MALWDLAGDDCGLNWGSAGSLGTGGRAPPMAAVPLATSRPSGRGVTWPAGAVTSPWLRGQAECATTRPGSVYHAVAAGPARRAGGGPGCAPRRLGGVRSRSVVHHAAAPALVPQLCARAATARATRPAPHLALEGAPPLPAQAPGPRLARSASLWTSLADTSAGGKQVTWLT